MARSLLVFGLAFAGVFMLAGPGWALLTGAVLVMTLWRREPDWRVLAGRVTTSCRSGAARVKTAPRRATAVTGMTGGLALVPAGLIMSVGVGVGVAVAGVLLIGLSVLTGQGA